MRQEKVLPRAFLQAWPPRPTRRIGSGSDMATSDFTSSLLKSHRLRLNQ